MRRGSERVSEQSGAREHDLGIVLTRGQTIEHVFRLLNPTDRPVKVLDAHALTPCCSEIAKVSRSIPAHGEGRLTVKFLPGYQSGGKSVGFAVKTDRADEPVIVYSLRAQLIAEVQVATVEGGDLSLLMGDPGKQTLRVVARRLGGAGRGAPATVVTGDAKARFVGETVEKVRADGVVETTRGVALDLPADRKSGSRTTTVTFGWADGRSWDHIAHWSVAAHLRAIPEALIVGADDDPVKSILIRSDTGPFRVIGIEGAREVHEESPPEGAAKSRLVRLSFDDARRRAVGPFDVTIRTDHPQQPEVVVSVLMASPAKAGAR